MHIFRTNSQTIETVLQEAKHAFNSKPNLFVDETILVCEGVNDVPNRKPIRWVMDYVQTYEDTTQESTRLWHKQWKYIIECKNVRSVEPFNPDELKVSSRGSYLSAQTFAPIWEKDEQEILNYIGEELFLELDTREIGVEDLRLLSTRKQYDELIHSLDERYSAAPSYNEVITKRLSRPSPLRSAILERDGTTCQICQTEGFVKKDGSRYAEVHHMIELNKQAPKTLQSWNLLIVCPTCHKKLHYANVKSEYITSGWKITLDGNTYITTE